MRVQETNIQGLLEIFPEVFGDDRGYFFESYNQETFKQHGIDISFLQDNQSMSKKNVLRGLHFQKGPFEQDKLLRVLNGSILDVAVDLRKGSSSYGKWEKFVISAEKKNMVLVPKGFAHGLLTLEEDTIVSYKCSNIYNKNSEMGLKWDDEGLNIDWNCENPFVSGKDQIQPAFKNFVSPFIID